MTTDIEKFINKEVTEIEKELGWFFKKYNFKLEKENGIFYKNKGFSIIFDYGSLGNGHPIVSEGIMFNDGGDYNYSFNKIINFIQKEKNKAFIDTSNIPMGWKYYIKYFESHLIPFLEMHNYKNKMLTYLKTLRPWY